MHHQVHTDTRAAAFAPFEPPAAETSPPPAGTDDSELLDCIERIIRRDQNALAELYDATANRVHGVAIRILKNVEAAEEVVSDVYFQAWREAERYDRARGPVQSWLLIICRSRALDALRRRDPAVIHPEPHQLLESQADGRGDLQDLLEATRSCSKVHDALATLTPLQRQLLALAFFRAYTYAEVATHFAMPLGSVKTLIRGALQKMRAAIGDPA